VVISGVKKIKIRGMNRGCFYRGWSWKAPLTRYYIFGLGWGGSSIVECLHSMHEALGSIPDTERKGAV
jgi:hypothetical protein